VARKPQRVRELVVAAMHPKMFVIGNRIEQAYYVLAGLSIEEIIQHGVGGRSLYRKLHFGITYNDFAVVLEPKLGTNLQRNQHSFFIVGHVSPDQYSRGNVATARRRLIAS
jgi:hypothetical protein